MDYTADLSEAQEKATDTVTCPSCGGKLVYSPADRALKCEYCGGKVNIDLSRHSEELNFYDLINANNNTWSNDTHVMRCNNCGAKTVISKKEINKNCPFCGTSNIVRTDELCGLKPNAVLPFSITTEQAADCVRAWAKRKLYAPRKFKKNVQVEDINGSYSPAFTFDTQTVTQYSGKLGKKKTYTKMVDGKSVTESYIEWFNISGTFAMDFDDVLVHASSAISQRNINRLSPFDTNNSNKYASEFLHGYSATQYTRSGTDCWEYAKSVMYTDIKDGILSKYDYDEEGPISLDVSYNNITYKYVLIPIYIGHSKFSKKLYNFFVNGRNGNVAGKAPVSALKVIITILSVFAAFALILLCVILKSR